MKVAQIVLGLAVITAMAFSIAWDPTGFTVRMPIGEAGQWKTIFNPDTKEVIATVISYLIIPLGLGALAITGLLLLKHRNSVDSSNSAQNNKIRNLIITNLVLGFLIAAGSFLVFKWGFPTQYTYSLQPPTDTMITTFISPAGRFITAQLLSLAASLLGAVFFILADIQLRTILISNRGGAQQSV